MSEPVGYHYRDDQQQQQQGAPPVAGHPPDLLDPQSYDDGGQQPQPNYYDGETETGGEEEAFVDDYTERDQDNQDGGNLNDGEAGAGHPYGNENQYGEDNPAGTAAYKDYEAEQHDETQGLTADAEGADGEGGKKKRRKKKKKNYAPASSYDVEDGRNEDDDDDDDDRDSKQDRNGDEDSDGSYDSNEGSVYGIDYDGDDDDDSRDRDYWGRERRNACDCCRHCLAECCRGFCIPPGFECRRCCTCPHGACYTAMGVILGIGGAVMSSLYFINCDIERIIIMYNGEAPPNAPRVKYGFFSRAPMFGENPDYMQCKWYPDEEKGELVDAWMRAARLFLIVSTLLGFIGCIFLFLALCVAFTPHTFEHWMMWNYLIAAIAIPFSYLIFGSALCSENDCKLGEGGVQAISIFLFWLCAANTVKGFPEAAPAESDDDDDDDLYYETEEDMWNDRAPDKDSWLYDYKPPDRKPVGGDVGMPGDEEYYGDEGQSGLGEDDEYNYGDDGQQQEDYADNQDGGEYYGDAAQPDEGYYQQNASQFPQDDTYYADDQQTGDDQYRDGSQPYPADGYDGTQQAADPGYYDEQGEDDYVGGGGNYGDVHQEPYEDPHQGHHDDYLGGGGGVDGQQGDQEQQQSYQGDSNYVIDDESAGGDDDVVYPQQNLPRVGEDDDGPVIT